MTLSAQPVDATASAPAFTAQQSRQAFSAHIANGSARTLGTLSGWCPGRTPSTLTATSTTWTVGQFACIVDPAFTTTQSVYEVANDANLTGSVTAANATNPRKDILYVTVNDAGFGDGSGSRVPVVSYLAGTAAPSPSAPATPARSFLIATISVPVSGGGSPTIALNPTYQVAAGGIMPVTSSATYPGAPYAGMSVYDLALKTKVTYNGTAWGADRRGPKLAGVVSVGSAPPAGLEDTYVGSFLASASAANFSQSISGLSIPALSYGYTCAFTPEDNAASLGQVVFVASVSNLTTLSGQAFTQGGAAITGTVRVHFDLTGA